MTSMFLKKRARKGTLPPGWMLVALLAVPTPAVAAKGETGTLVLSCLPRPCEVRLEAAEATEPLPTPLPATVPLENPKYKLERVSVGLYRAEFRWGRQRLATLYEIERGKTTRLQANFLKDTVRGGWKPAAVETPKEGLGKVAPDSLLALAQNMLLISI